MNDLEDLYQELIRDHSKSPRNYRELKDANRTAEGDNPLCGDHYKIFVRLDGEKITDIGFQGNGCAISKASASLLTETIKGKSIADAKKLFDNVRDMVTTGEAKQNQLGKLIALSGVHKFPARVKCAILSWHALAAALAGKDETVTTEES